MKDLYDFCKLKSLLMLDMNLILMFIKIILQYTSSKLGKDLSKEHPQVDYTPPSYITLLFTDLGILTPSAVSDELIKLYL
jgi:translation initiation factor 2B subunit (eIF-2B alpha/beta/delta family)